MAFPAVQHVRLVAASALVAMLAAPACSPSPRALSWTIELETAALRSAAAVVRTEIREGGCDGPARYTAEIRPGDRAPVPPVLARGTWGFWASATSSTCERIASDCDELELPGPTSVESLLHGVTATPACDASACTDGACGVPDAGFDAASAPGLDAGHDAGRLWPDAGPLDGGPPNMPALPCGLTWGADLADYVEVVEGSVSYPVLALGEMIQLEPGTTIIVHFAYRSLFSPFVWIGPGGGSFTVDQCGRSYACSTASASGAGLNNMPFSSACGGVEDQSVATDGECDVTIHASGLVRFRRLDADCRPTITPTVTLLVDGEARHVDDAPGNALLTWSATGVLGCTGTGTGFDGPQPASGSLALVNFLPAPFDYVLWCTPPIGDPVRAEAHFEVMP